MQRKYLKSGVGEASLGSSTMEEMVLLAKEAVEKACDDGHKRKWLGSVELSPYGNMGSGRVEFWGLEGTPMRGFVVANYGGQWVEAFDGHFKRLKVKRKGEVSVK